MLFKLIKIKIIFCSIMFLFFGIVNGEELTFSLSFQAEADAFIAGAGNADRPLSARSNGNPGVPDLPVKKISFLLPADADPATVKISIETTVWSDPVISADVSPIPPLSVNGFPSKIYWPEDAAIVNGRDMRYYGKDDFFPQEIIRDINAGIRRKWKLVWLDLYLAQFKPISKIIRVINGVKLKIQFRKEMTPSLLIYDMLGEKMRRELESGVLNFSGAVHTYSPNTADTVYYESSDNPVLMPGGSKNVELLISQKPVYIIVTTYEIFNNSRKLNEFILSKERRGFEVRMLLVDDEGAVYGDAAAEKIRQRIRGIYNSTGSCQYVLLIGNSDPLNGDVPMKMCYPISRISDSHDVPSDLYYADLTGNWDLDGDNLYGEGADDIGPGGIDFNYEVSVGRIPYTGNTGMLDKILNKIINYENTEKSRIGWRKRCLLPMAPSDDQTPGYTLGEMIINNILIPKKDWMWHRVYKQNFDLTPPPETIPCSVESTVAAWNSVLPGLTVWWTHGSPFDACDIMSIPFVEKLNDNFPAMTFQASCSNGRPEINDNLSYKLLENGCVNTVSASRDSWYWPAETEYENSPSNPGMAYNYTKKLVLEEKTAGNALNSIRQEIDCGNTYFWMNWLVYNLFGDPSLGLFTSSADNLNSVAYNCEGYEFTGNYQLVVPPEGITFSLKNPHYLHGMMFVVRTLGKDDHIAVKWYGVREQNASGCEQLTAYLDGNGAQLVNVCTPRDANGQMQIRLQSNDLNCYPVVVEVYNWRNPPIRNQH